MRWVTLFDLAGVALGSCRQRPRRHLAGSGGRHPSVGSTPLSARPGRGGSFSLLPGTREHDLVHRVQADDLYLKD